MFRDLSSATLVNSGLRIASEDFLQFSRSDEALFKDRKEASKRGLPEKLRSTAKLKDFLKTLDQDQKKAWTEKELKYIVLGYKFALNFLQAPQELHEVSIKMLLNNTFYHTLENMGARKKRDRELISFVENRSEFSNDALTIKYTDQVTRIFLRSKNPLRLIYLAAHEAIHYFQTSTEGSASNREFVPCLSNFLIEKGLMQSKLNEKKSQLESDRVFIKANRSKINLVESEYIVPKTRIIAARAWHIARETGLNEANVFLANIGDGLRSLANAYKDTVR